MPRAPQLAAAVVLSTALAIAADPAQKGPPSSAKDRKSSADQKSKGICLFSDRQTPFDNYFLKSDPKRMQPVYDALRFAPLELSASWVKPGENVSYSVSMTNTSKTQTLSIPAMQERAKGRLEFYLGHYFHMLEYLGPANMDLKHRKPHAEGIQFDSPNRIRAHGGHTVIPIYPTGDGGIQALRGRHPGMDIIWNPTEVNIPPGLTFEIEQPRNTGVIETKGLAKGTYELSVCYTTNEGWLIDTQRAIFIVDDSRPRVKKPSATTADDGK